METRLKALMRQRHWTYSTFCREYDRTAGSAAPELMGAAPSRAQLHRWMSGQLKGLPYPDHCRILEKLFPGWTVRQLFEPVDFADPAHGQLIDRLVGTVAGALDRAGAEGGGWGQPARKPSRENGRNSAALIAKRLAAVAQVRRFGHAEAMQLAGLAGHVVELGRTVNIAADQRGVVRVTQRHEVFNMSEKPLIALAREMWFQRTQGALDVAVAQQFSDRVRIEKQHEAGNLVKFACRLTPALGPGGIATVEYTCTGGILGDDRCWRQEVRNYTRHLTMTVSVPGADAPPACTVIEEHPDGAEYASVDDLLTDGDADTTTVTVTRDYLRPGQALTLHWT
ncbi:MAG: hypothetical protein HOQ24_17565 [Mycobacteriaceae bacterium]|nr:hypothetical protein [Mycobacteriaceae bacterium]